MTTTQGAIARALQLAQVLDMEHTCAQLHTATRAIRHELETLRDLHASPIPQKVSEAVRELASARKGRGTRPGSQRHRILGLLSAEARADFQVANLLDIDTDVVRKRRHELMAAGWVEPCVTDPMDEGPPAVAKVLQRATGRECSTYRVTTDGMMALGKLRSGQTVLFTDSELGNDLDTTPDKSWGSDVGTT